MSLYEESITEDRRTRRLPTALSGVCETTTGTTQLSSSCDIIRLLNPREMAIALNLPANYVSDLNCTDSKARTILGSAFGVKSIAHVLACLAGIGEA